MFSLRLAILALIIIINMVVVWIVASQSWRVKINRYFATGAVFVILWALGAILLIASTAAGMVLLGRILFLIAPMYTILFLSLFAAVFPAEEGRSFTLTNRLLALVTVAFSLYILYDPSQLVPISLLQSSNSRFVVNPFWYTVYTIYFNGAFLVTFGEFFRNLRRTRRGNQRQQVQYVFGGTLVSAVLALMTNLILPVFGVGDFIWLGPSWTLFYVLTISISIVRHRLFDIKLAAVRSIAYIGVLLTLSLVYYVIAYITSVVVIGTQTTNAVSVSPFNIFLALILAFLFQPVKRFFDRLTDDIFYRDDYRSDEFFASLSLLLTSTTELRKLLERSSRQLATTFKADQALFFVYYTNEKDHHISAGTRGHARLPLHDVRLLDEYVRTSDEYVILVDMLEGPSVVRRMLVSHRVALIMPLRQGEVTIGYVMLGEQLRGNYSKRDLNVLSTVSSELVIAIQNAMSLHEVTELNATLQQRVDVATRELRSSNAQLKHLDEVKDEFMSMASHQLRTPLTSVKGYISMVLEGDAGNITLQQQKLLMEAFKSSERMVGLIADFLNVSRLQTGKFLIEKTPFDMGEIVRQEVDDLQMIAASHNIKLRLKATHQPLPIVADESKIRQVIMNFIDNAIYYSQPKSTIVINVEKVKDDVALTVVDTGIGVPKDEQAHLFNKFFRAQNARKRRPDGTGVGLYLARRVITAHKGAIIFSSHEGKGSTFGFRLPLTAAPVSQPATKPEPTLTAAK
ncbi:MAG TPA: ATP-binding protein [Candidatus Bathyarchaeia archaeon]|nr:ATP-binding protein [Candidatus Bathyarchaeia archaeon]